MEHHPMPDVIPRPSQENSRSQTTSRPPRLRWFILAAGLTFGLILASGVFLRVHARHQLHAVTAAAAIPTVTIVHPGGMAPDKLVLPGRLQAWYSAPVYARTNGYLLRWYADIGQKVHEGQLLAEIDTPDVDLQLKGARAALATRAAQRNLAGITTRRWDRLNAQNAVSQQETDERRGNFAASEAMQREASAEVGRLETLSGFKHIVAPFTGVVTSRATDIGALIVAGASSAQPLFTVSDVSQLRIYVSVPQAYIARMREGMDVAFTVPDYPGRTFQAHLIRSSDAVDPQSGAMLVQLLYENSENLLKPGSYAQIAFTFPGTSTTNAVRIPASSLLFRRAGPTIAVMEANHHVKIHPITILTDFGTELEVTGLSSESAIIDNPRDDLRDGDEVKPQENGHDS